MEYRAERPQDLPAICRKILDATEFKVFLFRGDLGAGKTTMIKSFCSVLGSQDDFSSPTFALVNHYKTNDQHDIFHFDFYRLKNAEEALDIGFDEYLDSGSYCFIEWPDIAMKLIFTDYVLIEIKAEDNSRIIKVRENEPLR